jgi:predicted lactoylglutathione lyase
MAPRLIFINISVTNLQPSLAFYTALGFTQNKTFSDASTACVVLSDVIHVMLHEPTRFKTWVPEGKAIVDATKHTEVLLCVSAESKEEVDSWVEKAVAAGGKGDPTVLPKEGGMYGRTFEDLDGHVWEVGYMDFSQVPPHSETKE